MKPTRIALAVLVAGGQSRRMGTDKCLLEWKGQPLWERRLETLAALKPERLAVVAPEKPVWLPGSVSWIRDAAGLSGEIGPIGRMGPIAGLLAALEAAREGLVAALAVDLPAMSSEYLAQMQRRCLISTGIVPQSASGYEPLAAIYPASSAESARDWVAHGRRDLQGWIAQLIQNGSVIGHPIAPEDLPLFHNLNTPEDLA